MLLLLIYIIYINQYKLIQLVKNLIVHVLSPLSVAKRNLRTARHWKHTILLWLPFKLFVANSNPLQITRCSCSHRTWTLKFFFINRFYTIWQSQKLLAFTKSQNKIFVVTLFLLKFDAKLKNFQNTQILDRKLLYKFVLLLPAKKLSRNIINPVNK